MSQWQSLNSEGAILIDDVMFFPFHCVEDHFVAHPAAKIVKPGAHESFEVVAGTIDVEFRGAAEEIERAEQTNQPKAVISVKMREKDVVEAGEF